MGPTAAVPREFDVYNECLSTKDEHDRAVGPRLRERRLAPAFLPPSSSCETHQSRTSTCSIGASALYSPPTPARRARAVSRMLYLAMVRGCPLRNTVANVRASLGSAIRQCVEPTQQRRRFRVFKWGGEIGVEGFGNTGWH